MLEVKAPGKYKPGKFSIFLAGSIDMGNAEDWQTTFTNAMKDQDVLLLNPRRDDWDSSWKQEASDKQFSEQVNWELDALEFAKLIVVYFAKDSKAPITFMELGLHAHSGKVVVCCPEGFYRRGNVEIVCNQYGIPMVNDMDALTAEAIKRIPKKEYRILKDLK